MLVLMDQPLPEQTDRVAIRPLPFEREIILCDVGFRYSPGSAQILSGVNLRLEKGKRVGFIGKTGSGKSTLLDIVTGLLLPTDGLLAVDGCAITAGNQHGWQKNIAHVPQNLYLADASIEDNIAFGVPESEIDTARVRHAAQQAQLGELIESWPETYKTHVGERGIRLSGGQRQRVGIARALYKRASVIIFDEATNALDSQTERALMHAIDHLSRDLTIFIIAHRLSTLTGCDFIIELASGVVRNVMSSRELQISE